MLKSHTTNFPTLQINLSSRCGGPSHTWSKLAYYNEETVLKHQKLECEMDHNDNSTAQNMKVMMYIEKRIWQSIYTNHNNPSIDITFLCKLDADPTSQKFDL